MIPDMPFQAAHVYTHIRTSAPVGPTVLLRSRKESRANDETKNVLTHSHELSEDRQR